MKNFTELVKSSVLPLILITIFLLPTLVTVAHADERDDYQDLLLLAASENGMEISTSDPLFSESVDMLISGNIDGALDNVRFMSVRKTLIDELQELGLNTKYSRLDEATEEVISGQDLSEVINGLIEEEETTEEEQSSDVEDEEEAIADDGEEKSAEERAPPEEETDDSDKEVLTKDANEDEEPKETSSLDEETEKKSTEEAEKDAETALDDQLFSGERVVNLEETHGEMLEQLRSGMAAIAEEKDQLASETREKAAEIAGIDLSDLEKSRVDGQEESEENIADKIGKIDFNEALDEAQSVVGDAQSGLQEAAKMLDSMGLEEEAQELMPYLEKLQAAATYQGLEKAGATKSAINNGDYLDAISSASEGLDETADLLEELGAEELSERLGTYGSGLGAVANFDGVDNISATVEAIENGEYIGALGEANQGLDEVAKTLADLGQEDLAEKISHYNSTIDMANEGLQSGEATWDAIQDGDYQGAMTEAGGALGSITDLLAVVNEEIEDDGTVNVNSASAAELEELPGIGTTYAEAIVDYREENGSFASVDELENVSGIGPARLEGMAEYVRLEDDARHKVMENLELISGGAGDLAENIELIAEYEGIEQGSEAWEALQNGDYLASISQTGDVLEETQELLYQLTGGGVNVNTASVEELETLPGIGSTYAENIVTYREENGEFSSVDELENVDGIGPSRLEEISGKVRLEDRAYDEALAKLGEINGHVEKVTDKIGAVSNYKGIEYGSEAWEALQEGDYMAALNSASSGLDETIELVYSLTGGGVNVNTASASHLETLPGIGPSYAQAIVDYREENGLFEEVGELENVPGIGRARLEEIQDMVRLEDSEHDVVLERLRDVTEQVGMVSNIGQTALANFRESGEVRQTMDAIYAEHGDELEPYLERVLEEAVGRTGLSEEEIMTVGDGAVSLADFALTYKETGDFDQAFEHFEPQLVALEEKIETEIKERQANLMDMLDERFGDDVDVSEDGQISFSSGDLPDVDMDDLMDMVDNDMQEVWDKKSDGMTEGSADRPEEYIVAEIWEGVVAEAEISDEVRKQLEMGDFGEMDARAAYELSAKAEASGIELGRHVVRDPETGRYHTYDGFRQELYAGAKARADASVDFDWEDIELFGTAVEQQTHASGYAEVRAEAQITNVVGIVDGKAIGGHHKAGAFAGAMAGAQISHEVANEHIGAAEATVGGQVGVGIGAEAELDWQLGWDGIEFDGSLFAGLGVSAGMEFSFSYTPPEWMEDVAGTIAEKAVDGVSTVAEGIVDVGESVVDGVTDAAEKVKNWFSWGSSGEEEELSAESDESSESQRSGELDESEEEDEAVDDEEEATSSARELRKLIDERDSEEDDDYITSQDEEEEENPFISRIRIW